MGRPYRKAMTWNAAMQEIVEESGQQFDPSVVDAFQSCEPQLRRIYFELAAALEFRLRALRSNVER